ncbi:hypothetical protein, partial [Atlantibacter sp.]|uniref:hypothetical protein n=1 Tax=Atlantibacter sp. TaxID=1903473 RepID=UPI0028ADFFB2
AFGATACGTHNLLLSDFHSAAILLPAIRALLCPASKIKAQSQEGNIRSCATSHQFNRERGRHDET